MPSTICVPKQLFHFTSGTYKLIKVKSSTILKKWKSLWSGAG